MSVLKGAEGAAELHEFVDLLQDLLADLIRHRDEWQTADNRADLAEVEIFQAAVLEEYLPKQLSEDEIKTQLQAIITQVGAKGAGDMGKVMGVATKHFAGKADNKVVSQLVKQLLG